MRAHTPGQWHLLSQTTYCALCIGQRSVARVDPPISEFLDFKTEFHSCISLTADFLYVSRCISVLLEAVYFKAFRLRIKNILKSVDNLWFTKLVVADWNFVTFYSVFISLTFFLRNHWKESVLLELKRYFQKESVGIFLLYFFLK